MFAILLILAAEVAVQAIFLAKNLHEHDAEECRPNHNCLPTPKPNGSTGQISECACEHGIAVNSVRTSHHKMLCSRSNLMPECVHGITLALLDLDHGSSIDICFFGQFFLRPS